MQQKKTGRRPQKTNINSEFERQVATRVSQAMIIDELYTSINIKSDDEKSDSSDNENDSTIIQSTNNASFATIIRSDTNACTINWKKEIKQ